LLELLKQRRYAVTELNNVLCRRLNGEYEVSDPPGAVIRAGRPDESENLAQIVVRAFFPEGSAPPDFAALIAPMYRFDGAMPFVAEINGEIAACACGLVISEYGIVALFGAATLPEYRKRGLQTALHHARLKAAMNAGCEYAVVVTRAGTTSERNAERVGFQVAYSKATVLLPVETTNA